jgi:hypothetical protein
VCLQIVCSLALVGGGGEVTGEGGGDVNSHVGLCDVCVECVVCFSVCVCVCDIVCVTMCVCVCVSECVYVCVCVYT